MTQIQERTVDALNDVVSEDLNAVRAYEEATDHVDTPRLRDLFGELRQERSAMASELQQQVSSFGGDPVTDESLGGELQGAWMSLQASVTDDEADAIIDDLESAEESVADAYDDAISRDIEPAATELLESHRKKIHTAENRIEDLRNALDG
jgi:uncharacterized protein (TIGR02284 family)